MKSNLADRVAAALGAKATISSDELSRLIGEVSAARESTEASRSAARDRALDPRVDAKASAQARGEADDLGFEVDRLNNASAALRAAEAVAISREGEAKILANYQVVVGQRDALAKELREVYPEIEAKLIDLMTRVSGVDAAIERVNRGRLPSGADWLKSVDEEARGGREGFFDKDARARAHLVKKLRLPSFELNKHEHEAFSWPKPRLVA